MDDRDTDLLETYVRHKSDEAFARIVSRYVNLVHGAAMRQVRDAHLAEDVTQAAFIVLARRAASIKSSHLAGWLLRTVHFCAKDALKKQHRRVHHELEAATMNPTTTQPPEATESEITAALDEAMSHLRAKESTAVALRFLQNRSFAEVAAALGVSIDAAQKIVTRSLAKLRKILGKKGIMVPSAAALAEMLPHQAAHAAPAGLAAAVSSSSTQGLSIAKGAMHMMLWTKIKAGAVAAALVLAASAGGMAVLNHAMAADAPTPAPAAPPSANGDISAVPADAPAPSDPPFIELVGCRIKQSAEMKLSATPQPREHLKWIAQEYSQVHWTIDPALAANVSGYTISVVSVDNSSAPKIITADKTDDTQWLEELTQNPGDFIVAVTANGPNSTAVATADVHVTVSPLPVTQVMVSDFQPDGTIRFSCTMQNINRTGKVIQGDRFVDSDFVSLEKMTDDQGNPIQFTTTHLGNNHPQGEGVNLYAYAFNDPVRPGDAGMQTSSGTISGLLRQQGGVWEYGMNHSPGGQWPTRRIELCILPAGAQVIQTIPANLPARTIDGRTEVYLDVMVPVNGSSRLAIRYKL